MANQQRVIHVKPDSELARVLDDARDAPLLLEMDGILYRLSSEREHTLHEYNAEAALRGMADAAGSWSDINPEEFKAFIYRSRRDGSRPNDTV